jgi:hypothetical protein
MPTYVTSKLPSPAKHTPSFDWSLSYRPIQIPRRRGIYFESRLACIFLLHWLIAPSLAGLRSE